MAVRLKPRNPRFLSEIHPPQIDAWEPLRKVAFALLISAIWLFPASLRTGNVASGLESSAVNQVVWLALLVLSLFCMQTGWSRVRAQIDATMLLALAWCALTVPFALVPDVSARRYMLTLIALVATVVCVASVRKHRNLIWIILALTVADILLKYGVVFALPKIGIHQGAEVDPQLAGLWRGQYSHKNLAAAACAVQIIALIAARRLVPAAYLIPLVLLDAYFLLRSGSRTSIVLAVVAISLAMVMVRTRSAPGIAVVIGVPLLIINALTVFTVLNPELQLLAQTFVSDISFTGRADVWKLLIDYVSQHPVTGAGFLSFWQVGAFSPAQQDGRTWLASAAHGHQGYLDLAAAIGLPGLFFVVAFVFLRPVFDIAKIQKRDNTLLELYCGLWCFALLHNATESSLFDRAHLVWIMLLLAIFGIRRLALEDAKTLRRDLPLGTFAFTKSSRSSGSP